MKRGQTAVEFMILLGVVVFFFILFLAGLNANLADKTKENRDFATKEIALTVQNEVSLAVESIEGYRREFELPEKIINLDYEINISDGLVFVRTTDGKHALSLPVPNVTGDVVTGKNVIEKKDGNVFLND